MVLHDLHSYAQLQFELAEAPGRKSANIDREVSEQKRLLRRASSLRSALRHLTMEVEWTELGRTGSRHVRDRGYQVLNHCRPVVRGGQGVHAACSIFILYVKFIRSADITLLQSCVVSSLFALICRRVMECAITTASSGQPTS